MGAPADAVVPSVGLGPGRRPADQLGARLRTDAKAAQPGQVIDKDPTMAAAIRSPEGPGARLPSIV